MKWTAWSLGGSPAGLQYKNVAGPETTAPQAAQKARICWLFVFRQANSQSPDLAAACQKQADVL